MTGMATVLAAHDVHEFGREEGDASRWFDRCICGFVLFDIDHSPEHKVHAGKSYADSAFAAHVAEALTAAGFGSTNQAKSEALREAADLIEGAQKLINIKPGHATDEEESNFTDWDEASRGAWDEVDQSVRFLRARAATLQEEA